MNAQFHTPSFGDEEFDLTDVEPEPAVQISNQQANRTNVVNNQTSNNSEIPEPVKPVSAYALFFRDTVSAIKAQNPNTSFEDISKIVNSMWQVLDPTHKNVYNKKSDLAKKEYIQKIAAYRNSQMRQVVQEQHSTKNYEQVEVLQNPNISSNPVQVASRPAVFTISRPVGDSQSTTQNDQQTAEASQNNIVYCNNMNLQQQPKVNATPNPQAPTIQNVIEAGSVQICLRENCNKRAIINPDWEDEYCSNECVVIHCRNVFNQWVKSNIEGQV